MVLPFARVKVLSMDWHFLGTCALMTYLAVETGDEDRNDHGPSSADYGIPIPGQTPPAEDLLHIS